MNLYYYYSFFACTTRMSGTGFCVIMGLETRQSTAENKTPNEPQRRTFIVSSVQLPSGLHDFPIIHFATDMHAISPRNFSLHVSLSHLRW